MELRTFYMTVSCAAILNMLKSRSVASTGVCQIINSKIMGLVILSWVIIWSSSLKMKTIIQNAGTSTSLQQYESSPLQKHKILYYKIF